MVSSMGSIHRGTARPSLARRCKEASIIIRKFKKKKQYNPDLTHALDAFAAAAPAAASSVLAPASNQRCKNVQRCKQCLCKKNLILGKIFAKFYDVLSRK